jgi:hypothetical protein
MTESMRLAMGVSSPVKTKFVFDELDPHALACEALDKSTQVIQVPGEPVHAVHNHGPHHGRTAATL